MDYLNVIFPYLSDSEIEVCKVVPPRNSDLPNLNSEIMELEDVLFVVDPVTGHPENPVSKLLSGNLSVFERDKILATLQPMPSSKRHNLSDEDLINMLPSRYNSTLTDMDAVRDFFENNILNEIDEQDVDQGDQGGQGDLGGQAE